MQIVNEMKRHVPIGLRSLVRKPYPMSARPWLQSSFSQAGEDRIVAFVFAVLGVPRPTYLDVGAYHPFHLSNTALLHQGGSRGANIEPDPDSFRAFRRHRAADLNINVGVGADAGHQTLYRMSTPTLNTFSKQAAEEAVQESDGRHQIVGTVEIEIRTMARILHDLGAPPDFLTLDVEGRDLEIVRTIHDWPALPTVVCVETLTYSEHGLGTKRPEFRELLGGMGYLAYADTHINTIFVRSDQWTGH
jgi:FkbM family methyltransferase